MTSGRGSALIDKDEIIDLSTLLVLVDHRLYDEVVELSTEDCVVDYGPGVAMHGAPGLVSGRCSDIPRAVPQPATIMPHPGDVRGPRSRIGAYICVRLAPAARWGHASPLGLLPLLVVRRPEGWRIAERQLRALGVEDWNVEMHSSPLGRRSVVGSMTHLRRGSEKLQGDIVWIAEGRKPEPYGRVDDAAVLDASASSWTATPSRSARSGQQRRRDLETRPPTSNEIPIHEDRN